MKNEHHEASDCSSLKELDDKKIDYQCLIIREQMIAFILTLTDENETTND